MFKNYEELINFAKSQERVKGNNQPYWESHHILPRSMGGKDTLDNLVLLSVAEHVEAHYLLALQYENVNKQYYYANLSAAWMVCHGKSKFTARKREEVEKWLSNPDAQAFTLKLKEQLRGAKHPERKGFDAFKNKKRIWVQKGTQKPRRILESSKSTDFFMPFIQIPDCPICHNANSDESFACCKEHEVQYLLQKKEEYKKLKAEQTKTSWDRPEDRELRIKNNNGQHGPKEKHIWVTNGSEDKLILATETIPDGYVAGRSKNIPINPHTDEWRKNMSERRKNSCYVWKDDIPCKEIKKEELEKYINDGWNEGKKPGTSTSRKGIKQPKMVWVNKSGEVLRIRESDLENYLNNGYHRGIKTV
jgi:hypothetical protein